MRKDSAIGSSLALKDSREVSVEARCVTESSFWSEVDSPFPESIPHRAAPRPELPEWHLWEGLDPEPPQRLHVAVLSEIIGRPWRVRGDIGLRR